MLEADDAGVTQTVPVRTQGRQRTPVTCEGRPAVRQSHRDRRHSPLGRPSSEIAWMGVNTRTLSSQKAKLFGRGIQRMSLNRTTTAGGATEAAMRAQKDEASR